MEAAVETGQKTAEGLTGFRIGPLEILLLLILAVLLIRFYKLWRSEVRAGPVEVTIDSAPDDKVKGAVLARLQDRLLAVDVVPPPPVPVPTVVKTLGTALAESGLPQASWLGKVVQALGDLINPPTGYRAVCRIYDQPGGKKAVAYVLSDIVTGRTVFGDTSTADSYDAAAAMTAYAVYARLSQEPRVLAKIPVWNRWMAGDGSSIRKFHEAKDLERRGDRTKAVERYKEVVEAEPRNALARFALAAAQEAQQEYLDALRNYLETVALWPEYLEARYRLAAIYTFADVWWECWRGKERRDRLKELIRGADPSGASDSLPSLEPPDASPASESFRKHFLCRADLQYRLLEAQLDWRVRLLNWLRATESARAYHRQLLGLWPGSLRTRFLQLVVTAKLVGRIQLGAPVVPMSVGERLEWRVRKWLRQSWTDQQLIKLDRVVTLRPGPGEIDPRVRYNVACGYARAAEAACDPSASIKTSIRHLERVVRHPAIDLRALGCWMGCEDPDLRRIRSDPAFQLLLDLLELKCRTVPAAPGPQPSSSDLCYALQLVRTWSRERADVWLSRAADVASWTGVQVDPLTRWVVREIQCWERLQVWTASPTDEERRLRFWEALKRPDSGDAPDIALPERDPECETADESYRDRWQGLAGLAGAELKLWWDRLKQLQTRQMSGAALVATADEVFDWIQHANHQWREVSRPTE